MKFLEEQTKKIGKLFEKGKPLEKFYPFYEAIDTFLLTPGKRTTKAPLHKKIPNEDHVHRKAWFTMALRVPKHTNQ